MLGMSDKADNDEIADISAYNIATVQAELAEAAARDQARAKRQKRPEEQVFEQRRQLLMSLIRARRAKKLTQADLADKLGVQQSTIARIESGKGNPGLTTLLRIAKALEVNLVLE
jgi:DNA-binding XRE family transcriptional regulator